jgi:hypothetical protein
MLPGRQNISGKDARARTYASGNRRPAAFAALPAPQNIMANKNT